MSVKLGDELERRTVAHLTSLGYHAERVSRRGRYGTRDLFGCVDLVAVSPEGPMFIQVTTHNNASSHRRKIREAGLPWPVRLWVWRKTKGRWSFTSEEVLVDRDPFDFIISTRKADIERAIAAGDEEAASEAHADLIDAEHQQRLRATVKKYG